MKREYAPDTLMRTRGWGKQLARVCTGRDGGVDQVLSMVSRAGLPCKHPAGSDEARAQGIAAMAAMDLMVVMEQGRYRDIERLGPLSAVEGQTALSVARYALNGRHVVQIDAGFTTEFAHTSLSQVSLADVKLPWESFYLAFDGPDAPGGDGIEIDGVLVVRHADARRHISLTLLSPPTPAWDSPGRKPDMQVKFRTDDDRDIETAMRDAIDQLHGDLRNNLIRIQSETDASKEDHVVPAPNGGASLFLPHFERAKPIFEQCVALVCNALVYMTSRPEDGVERWQDGSPQKLLDRIATDGKKAERSFHELLYAGFTKVRYLTLPDAQETGRGVTAHWRRGHYKRQRYGKGLSEVRIDWRRPTLVAGTAVEANATGRVHVISEQCVTSGI